MTKDPAAQRCANLANIVAFEQGSACRWSPESFSEQSASDCVAFLRYVQAVSDALEESQRGGFTIPPVLVQFILPKTADKLELACKEYGLDSAKRLREALAKHGFKIVWEDGE